MTGWDTEDLDGIVQNRRMRGGSRRRTGGGALTWVAVAIVVLLAVGAGLYFILRSKPTGLDALTNPPVIAPGGFNATLGPNDTVTIGLVVHNNTDVPLTLASARIVAPAGLTSTALTIIPPGSDNTGFALDGDLPALKPVQLGTDATSSNAIIAARYTVNCRQLLLSTSVNEAIFVTVSANGQQREQELTPPVVGDEQWLTASAKRLCLDPVPTGGSTDQPLPPQPGGSSPAAQ